jgi:hypothetical protein
MHITKVKRNINISITPLCGWMINTIYYTNEKAIITIPLADQYNWFPHREDNILVNKSVFLG